MKTAFALVLACSCAASWAQTAAPQPDEQTRGGEPQVTRTVIEDNGTRIEELRVRGQLKRITVTPKGGQTRSYEIITSDGSRETSDNVSGTRGATGKRVWNVFSF